MKPRILVIDDEGAIRDSLRMILEYEDYQFVGAASGQEGLALVQRERPDLVMLDIKMPGMDGMEVLRKLHALDETLPVVMISGHGTTATAVDAIRSGATDFLDKPLSSERVIVTLRNALTQSELRSENRELRLAMESKYELVGQSAALRQVLEAVKRAAPTNATVMLLGESGVGKELVARTVHRNSPRAGQRFVQVNCAAIPEELIESELFGHEKGSFTGAAARHLGKFEQAHGGTLFLDEIGDMPPAMQAKLLRLLQEGELERIGGERPIVVNTRVIVATHRDLEALVRKGTFREDLYHRIFVFPITLPPLRERVEDIPLLAEHFASIVAEQNGWKPRTFSPEAIEQLTRYSWPGNVRELRNVVERLLLLTDDVVDGATARQILAGRHASAGATSEVSGPLADRVSAFEREVLLAELQAHGYNVAETARTLGLERSHFYKKCQQLGIDVKAERSHS